MSRDTARARSGASRTSLHDEITTKIIAEPEAGRVPWVQPWGTTAAKAPLAMPKNASTGRFYSGINADPLGLGDRAWLTGPRLADVSPGPQSRRQRPQGRARNPVVYADRFIPDDEKKRAQEIGEEAQAIPFLKRFIVFLGKVGSEIAGQGVGRRRGGWWTAKGEFL